MENYKKKYEEAMLRMNKWVEGSEIIDPKEVAEFVFPELAESEDERIKKALIRALKNLDKDHYNMIYLDGFSIQQCLAWLEKQGETNETINRDKFAQGVLRGVAINLITWIDYNAAEGNMCLSNMECEDIEDALVSGNWDKIYRYIKKKLEKQSKQNSTDSYCQDNCKGFQETGKCFADGECKAKRDAENKPTQEIESFEAEHGKYYYCIKDYFCGGRKQASKGDVVQALRGLPIMSLKDASEYFLPVNNVYSTR